MRTFLVPALLLAAAPVVAAPITSTFDTDLDGWTHVNAPTFEWRDNDGNPPGYVFADNNEMQLAYIFAPAKFRGDLRAYNGGTISFDGKLLGAGGSFYNNTNFDYGSIRIANNTLNAVLDLAPAGEAPPAGSWKTFSAPLTAAAWGKTEEQWLAILANVTELRIGIEALFGAEAHGIDNITVAPVPAPAGAWLLGTALVALGARRYRR